MSKRIDPHCQAYQKAIDLLARRLAALWEITRLTDAVRQRVTLLLDGAGASPPDADEIVWRKDSLAMVDASTFTPFTTAGSAIDTAASAALDPLWAGDPTAEEATADAAQAIAEALGG